MTEEQISATEHKVKMQQQQQEVRARIAEAKTRRGIIIYHVRPWQGQEQFCIGTLARSLGTVRMAPSFNSSRVNGRPGNRCFLRNWLRHTT